MSAESLKIPVEYLVITTSDWTMFELMQGGRWQSLKVEYVEGKDRLAGEAAAGERFIRIDKAVGDSSLVIVKVKGFLNLEGTLGDSVLKYRLSKGDMESAKVIVTGRAGKTVAFVNSGKISGSQLNTRIFSCPVDLYFPDFTKEKVVVAHGKDAYQAQRLKEFLRSRKVEAATFDIDAKEKTLLEKTKYIQDNVTYAFAVLTADDVGCLRSSVDNATAEQLSTSKEKLAKLVELLQPRAGQNVLFEVGLLIGALGKENVCLLKQKSLVDLPGDFDGEACLEFDFNVDEKFKELQGQLLGLNSPSAAKP